MAPTFVLTRILGNDLPPRHGARQTLANLAFLLEHEPAFPSCEKRWVVNRIGDAEREAELIATLTEHRQAFVHLRYEPRAYARRFLDGDGLPPGHDPLAIAAGEPTGLPFEWLYRHKNRYAINVNGARNAALDDGFATGARWVMPWDGACFLTADAFAELAALAASDPEARYIVIPMARQRDNATLLAPGFRPAEMPDEPQLVFRSDARDRFDERFRYGHMPKAELLRRLGVPGPWQKWFPAEWERGLYSNAAEDRGRFVAGGWVARLDTAASDDVETGAPARWSARFAGLAAYCARLDRELIEQGGAPDGLVCYGPLLATLSPGSTGAARIVAAADALLSTSAVSVTDKPVTPQGIGANDYVSIRRYAHQKLDGIWHTVDGVSNPAAMRGGDGSELYDRFRLQTMIDTVTGLALARRITGDTRYSAHAAAFVRAWFIDPATRMAPHRRFAQIMPGRPGESAAAGFVDFRDVWALVDALRILAAGNALAPEDTATVTAWFAAFRDDLLSEAEAAARLRNNLGAFHDLLLASVASAAGDTALLATVITRAPLRFGGLIAGSGQQNAEMTRTRPLHYSLFALQAMIGLATLGRASGIDLWQWAGADRRTLATALRFAAVNRAAYSDYAADPERFDDRIEMALRAFPADAADHASLVRIERRAVASVTRLGMDDGFAPWWPLLLAREGDGFS